MDTEDDNYICPRCADEPYDWKTLPHCGECAEELEILYPEPEDQ
jgi:hypothetical protein